MIVSILILLFILGIYSVAGIFQRKVITQEIGELWNNKLDNITKMNIADGKTGKRYIISDKEKIKEFLQILDGRTVTASKTKGGMGYSFIAELYSADIKTMLITLRGGDFIQINSAGYDLSQPVLNQDIRLFLETLDK